MHNRFRYELYFLFLDIDTIPETAAALPLLAYNRRGLVSFHDRDHGPRDGGALRPWIDGILATAEIELAGGRIMLLAFPRVLGGRFFPVSFWYCFHEDGTLRAVLAEVNNTFHEHHNYLLHDGGAPLTKGHTLHATKVFHVSPFIAMDARYEFQFTGPDERLGVRMLDVVEGEPLLTVELSLERQPLRSLALLATVLRYGPMSTRAWLLIRWQAVRLWRKGATYVHRPALPTEETT